MNVGEVIGRTIPALLLVLAVPLGAYWWARRSGSTGAGADLRIGAKAAFGKNLWVAVVEVDGRRFLVGVGDGGINVIAELDRIPAPDAGHGTDADEGTERPGMGLVRRLQHMTVRKPTGTSWRPRVPAS